MSLVCPYFSVELLASGAVVTWLIPVKLTLTKFLQSSLAVYFGKFSQLIVVNSLFVNSRSLTLIFVFIIPHNSVCITTVYKASITSPCCACMSCSPAKWVYIHLGSSFVISLEIYLCPPMSMKHCLFHVHVGYPALERDDQPAGSFD